MTAYLANAEGPSLKTEHGGSTNDVERSLNETVTDKIRKCRSDYNNNQPNTTSFIHLIPCTSGRLHSEFVTFILKGSSGN